jgi:vesicle coat complex subunit
LRKFCFPASIHSFTITITCFLHNTPTRTNENVPTCQVFSAKERVSMDDDYTNDLVNIADDYAIAYGATTYVPAAQEPRRDTTMSAEVPATIRGLSSEEEGVRMAALYALSDAPAASLISCTAFIMELLRHADSDICWTAAQALGKLPAEALDSHASHVIRHLEDPDSFVRSAAVHALAKLPAETLTAYAPEILGYTQHTDADVRAAAISACEHLPVQVLVDHSSAVLRCLEDPTEYVRSVTVELLGKLPAETLATHFRTGIAPHLSDRDWNRALPKWSMREATTD